MFDAAEKLYSSPGWVGRNLGVPARVRVPRGLPILHTSPCFRLSGQNTSRIWWRMQFWLALYERIVYICFVLLNVQCSSPCEVCMSGLPAVLARDWLCAWFFTCFNVYCLEYAASNQTMMLHFDALLWLLKNFFLRCFSLMSLTILLFVNQHVVLLVLYCQLCVIFVFHLVLFEVIEKIQILKQIWSGLSLTTIIIILYQFLLLSIYFITPAR